MSIKEEGPVPAAKPNGITENPWIDDVGLLKDRRQHFTVDRLVTCNCITCRKQAQSRVRTSYELTFGREMPEETGAKVVTLYEKYIDLARIAQREIPPKNDSGER